MFQVEVFWVVTSCCVVIGLELYVQFNKLIVVIPVYIYLRFLVIHNTLALFHNNERTLIVGRFFQFTQHLVSHTFFLKKINRSGNMHYNC